MGRKNNIWELNQKNISKIFDINFGDDLFSVEDVIEREFLMKLGLKQGIIYNYDKVLTDNIEDLAIDLDNMIEGRLFNEKIELRVFYDDDKLKGSIFVEDFDGISDETEYISESFILYNRNKDKNYANKLEVKKYIDYDEDKQAYIYYTKPCKLNFRGENR